MAGGYRGLLLPVAAAAFGVALTSNAVAQMPERYDQSQIERGRDGESTVEAFGNFIGDQRRMGALAIDADDVKPNEGALQDVANLEISLLFGATLIALGGNAVARRFGGGGGKG